MNCPRIHPDFWTRCQLAEGHITECKFPTMTPAAVAEVERTKELLNQEAQGGPAIKKPKAAQR